MNTPYNGKASLPNQDATDRQATEAATTDGMALPPDPETLKDIAICNEPLDTAPDITQSVAPPRVPATPCAAPLPDQVSAQQWEQKEKHKQEVDAAAITLGHEQHEYLGVVDTVKALLLIKESPEARVEHDQAGEHSGNPDAAAQARRVREV